MRACRAPTAERNHREPPDAGSPETYGHEWRRVLGHTKSGMCFMASRASWQSGGYRICLQAHHRKPGSLHEPFMVEVPVKVRFRQDVNPAQKIKQRQHIELGQDLARERAAEELEEQESQDAEEEAPEPPTLEDLGDSDWFVEDSVPGSAFDRAWNGPLPLIWQLPRHLRPPVSFRIDSNFEIHPMGEKTKTGALEQAIAEAIVEHLRRKGVEFHQPGDWCSIPCIGGDAELIELQPEHLPARLDLDRLRKTHPSVKDFAIELPNGDVITPQALLDRARENKRTTRAAALRCASQRPEVTPDGERWTAQDWKDFEITQRKKNPRRRTAK